MQRGGAVRLRGDPRAAATAIFEGCAFEANVANAGGAVDVAFGSRAFFAQSYLAANAADDKGGGVYLEYR